MQSKSGDARPSGVHGCNIRKWHGKLGLIQSSAWYPPHCVLQTDEMTRDRRIHNCDSINASEYLDHEEVFHEKILAAAELIRKAQGSVVAYTGAGISTSAGIQDYASKKNGIIYQTGFAGEGKRIQSIIPTKEEREQRAATETYEEAQCRIIRQKKEAALKAPSLGHHALALLHKAGCLQYWVSQNHDRLSQKAGYPLEALNEIHGAWWDRENPVRGIKTKNQLREDLVAELDEWMEKERLCIAVGTTLCGMSADRIATEAAEAEDKDLIIIGLQQTPHDQNSSLRIWGRSDDVLAAVTRELLGQNVELPDPQLQEAGIRWWKEAMQKSKEHPPCRLCKEERLGCYFDTPRRG